MAISEVLEVNKIYEGNALDVIKTFPDKDGIILDPFCGTATTGCRAIDLDRKFIGIEGKEEYVKMGNRKLHKYLISPKLF